MGWRAVRQVFFESAGRMARGPFLIAIVGVVAVFALYERFVVGWLHGLTGWLAHLVLLFAGVSVLAKRLHDRGRSGWWAAVIVAAFCVAWPWPRGWVDGLFMAVLAVAAVDLGALPGQPAANRFGPPPKASAVSA